MPVTIAGVQGRKQALDYITAQLAQIEDIDQILSITIRAKNAQGLFIEPEIQIGRNSPGFLFWDEGLAALIAALQAAADELSSQLVTLQSSLQDEVDEINDALGAL